MPVLNGSNEYGSLMLSVFVHLAQSSLLRLENSTDLLLKHSKLKERKLSLMMSTELVLKQSTLKRHGKCQVKIAGTSVPIQTWQFNSISLLFFSLPQEPKEIKDVLNQHMAEDSEEK
jgi:hypothetical protein